MILSMAPMEGLTGYVFRNVHAECFGPLDRYHTPFLHPARVGSPFDKRQLKEVDPANNAGLTVIPQLLSKDADEFVWSASLLAELGYGEANLNAGCPSGTVTAKGRGAGLLDRLDDLGAFLSDACERSCIPVSVKTRIGFTSDAEFGRILDVYCKKPLAELIVHPRVREDFYKGVPRCKAYGKALESASFPVAYNGDVFTPADAETLLGSFPQTQHIMLGRGLLANPALARMIKGGPAASREELQYFHDRLFSEYEKVMGGNAVFRMKEWWFYAKHSFEDPISITRAIRGVKKAANYRAVTAKIFQKETLTANPRFKP